MVKSKHRQMETSNVQRIRNCLTDIRSRMYRQGLLQTLTYTIFCGLVLLAILSLLSRVILLPIQMSSIIWIVIFLAGIVGICLSIKHWKDLQFIAQVVDEKMDLRERLSTAFGLIQNTTQGEFAQSQIRDAAKTARTLDKKRVQPYRVPQLSRMFPIPILLIGISFGIPTFYDVPRPLTEFQQKALDRVVQSLEQKQVKDPALQKQIRATISRLKVTTDLNTAQEHLSDLNTKVRKAYSAQAAIVEAMKASQHFRGMDADNLGSELKEITKQAEIPLELRAELQSLFERLVENLPEGALRNSLNQVQDKTVTLEHLQDIIDTLQKAETLANLAGLEAELMANRKELALADIQTTSSDGGIANAAGTPGQNAGTREVQGTREAQSNFEPQSTLEAVDDKKIENITEAGDPTTALISDETPALQVNGASLTLTAGSSGDSESFSGVFMGEPRTDAPPYLPFSDVILNATRTYAEAINNNLIPIKYRTQIKAYLEAIAKKNEEKPD